MRAFLADGPDDPQFLLARLPVTLHDAPMKSCLGMIIVMLAAASVIGGGGLLWYLSYSAQFSRVETKPDTFPTLDR